MQYNRLRRSLIAVSLVLTMVFSTLCFGGYVSAAKVSDLEDKQENLENKNDEIKDELEDVRDDKNEVQTELNRLQTEMEKIQKRLDELTRQIDDYNTKIEELDTEIEGLNEKIAESNRKIEECEKEIKAKEVEFKQLFNLLKKRLRALYIAGDASSLEILLTASDISDFLNRYELVKGVAEHDSELLAQVRDIVGDLNTSKNSIESEKLFIQGIRQQTVSKRDDQKELKNGVLADKAEIDKEEAKMDQLIADGNAKLEKLKDKEFDLQNQYKKNEDAINDLDQQIKDIINGSGSSGGGSGSSGGGTGGSAGDASNGSGAKINMIWPVQGCSTYISSPYGPRWGTIHRGIDITGGNIYGKNVVAVASGKVILALNTSTGYGRYVIVDHGNGVATLYAHCSQLKVSVGQKVSQGQTIALVGSTGNSTGPHLHFEVRINGEKVNPANYL